jgi:hypothetical protein
MHDEYLFNAAEAPLVDANGGDVPGSIDIGWLGPGGLSADVAHVDFGDPGLFEAEELAPLQVLEAAVEDLLGHAVCASEVAPVGDRDAKVSDGATQRVSRRVSCGGRHVQEKDLPQP